MGNCVSQKKVDNADSKKNVDVLKNMNFNKAILEDPLGLSTNFGYSRKLKERYVLEKELGHGEFGTVYEAVRIEDGERFACKSLRKHNMKTIEEVEDVKREVSIMRVLVDHPNIVHFEDLYEDDENVFIVMELCEGGELLDHLLAKKNKCFDEKDAVVIVRQMLTVVAEFHLRGVIHRDLKIENFLFKSKEENSVIKVIDFGFSGFRKPNTSFTDVVGSAYYMAPEVLNHHSGAEADVWSVGVLTYMILSGDYPFWDEKQDNVFIKILKQNPNLYEGFWPSISEEAKDLVMKLLCKDPKSRYTAAQSLSHPWVRREECLSEIPLDISVLENLRSFAKYSRFKQFALRTLAKTLDESEVLDLQDQFRIFDVDKDGLLSLKDFENSFERDRLNPLTESQVSCILKAMDFDLDGYADFQDFSAAALHVDQLQVGNNGNWMNKTKQAFLNFDLNDDGYIDADDLKRVLKIHGSVHSAMEEADLDGDGRISLPEFRRLLKNAKEECITASTSNVYYK